MPIWHQSPKLTPRYFLETPRLFGYPRFQHLCSLVNNPLNTHRVFNPTIFEANF